MYSDRKFPRGDRTPQPSDIGIKPETEETYRKHPAIANPQPNIGTLRECPLPDCLMNSPVATAYRGSQGIFRGVECAIAHSQQPRPLNSVISLNTLALLPSYLVVNAILFAIG